MAVCVLAREGRVGAGGMSTAMLLEDVGICGTSIRQLYAACILAVATAS